MTEDTPTSDFPDHPIGDAVQRWRKICGLKQQDLAKRVGMSAAQLCHIEKSRNVPSVRTLRRIAEALGISVAELASPVASADRPVRGQAAPVLDDARPSLREPPPPGPSYGASSTLHRTRLPAGPRDPDTGFLLVRDPSVFPTEGKDRRAMAAKVRDYLALEEETGVPTTPLLAFRHPSAIAEGQGETLARLIRCENGVGHGVPFDSIAFFESKGIRVIVTDLPPSVPSCSLFDDAAGNAVVFLRKGMSEERRQFRMAAEIAHVIRFVTKGCEGPLDDSPETRRFAREFASAFLLPEEALNDAAHQLGLRPGTWTLDLLLRVKQRFGVTAEVFAYRLEATGLLTSSLRAAFVARLREYEKGHAGAEPNPLNRHLQRHSRYSDLKLLAKERHRA